MVQKKEVKQPEQVQHAKREKYLYTTKRLLKPHFLLKFKPVFVILNTKSSVFCVLTLFTGGELAPLSVTFVELFI